MDRTSNGKSLYGFQCFTTLTRAFGDAETDQKRTAPWRPRYASLLRHRYISDHLSTSVYMVRYFAMSFAFIVRSTEWVALLALRDHPSVSIPFVNNVLILHTLVIR